MSPKNEKNHLSTHPTTKRNVGLPFSLAPLAAIQINRSAVERRISNLTTQRAVKKEWQVGWLLKAVSCIDLTTLSGDDTPDKVKRLTLKARYPVRSDLLKSIGYSKPLTTAAVCVYHNFIPVALQAVKGSNIQIAAVSTGFPAGHISMDNKINQIKASVAAGANEIDIVISRNLVLTGNWSALYDEVSQYRAACGDAHIKTILATGELGTLDNVAKASMVCMMAGADFIKTSTGKEPENATLPVSLVMLRMIRDYYEQTSNLIGFKPAGGIKTAQQSLHWLMLLKEELGDQWLNPHLFRFGASTLLSDIERQIEHFATGRYSAFHRHPLG